MKTKLTFSLPVILLCPLMMAPTAFTGGLGGFSGGTQGGQTASDWGIPDPQGDGQSPAGEGNKQQPNEPGEGNKQQPNEPGEGNKQQPNEPGEGNKQEPNEPGEGNKQEPNEPGEGNKQEPNEPGEGNKQEPNEPGDGESPVDPNKGEPNYPPGSSSSSSSSGGGSSSSSSSSGGNGSGSGDPYPPLGPRDPGYDPGNETNDAQVPSGCAEAGSACAQCVRRHEDAIQFNRRYLHIAWATSNDTIQMANKALAFGDNVSGIHATQGLAWQLGGRPQIEEAVADLKKTYSRRYEQYLGLIEQSLQAMSACEEENFAIRDLYARFGFLYMEFLRARYKSPD